MFITKKALQERIAKAVAEKEKEMWLNERIDRVEYSAFRNHCKLDERVRRLERMHEVDPEPVCESNPIGYVKE